MLVRGSTANLRFALSLSHHCSPTTNNFSAIYVTFYIFGQRTLLNTIPPNFEDLRPCCFFLDVPRKRPGGHLPPLINQPGMREDSTRCHFSLLPVLAKSIEVKNERLPAVSPHSPFYVALPPLTTETPNSPLMDALRVSVIGNFEALDKLTLGNNLDGSGIPSSFPFPTKERPSITSPTHRRQSSNSKPTHLASVASPEDIPTLTARAREIETSATVPSSCLQKEEIIEAVSVEPEKLHCAR